MSTFPIKHRRNATKGLRCSWGAKGWELTSQSSIARHQIICELHVRDGQMIVFNECPACTLLTMPATACPEGVQTVLRNIELLIADRDNCKQLIDELHMARHNNLNYADDLRQGSLLEKVFHRVCRTFCCEDCDRKHSPDSGLQLENAWTRHRCAVTQAKVYQTMDMILAAKDNSFTWGLNQKWNFAPVRLINEPDNKKENNAMFIHAFASKQRNPNRKKLTPTQHGQGHEPKRHRLLVIAHKMIHPGQPICAFYGDAFNRNSKYKAYKQNDIVESLMVDDQLLTICTNSQAKTYYTMDAVTNSSNVNTCTRKSARRRLMNWATQNIL